jgi:ectoine hydroxylase
VYGCHVRSELFRRVACLPRILAPAMQILDGPVYVHQYKVNAKAPMGGDKWEWHQDYIFWRNEDGMPAPRVLNVAIFLDEVHEFNGPMLVLPGSQREGVIEIGVNDAATGAAGDADAPPPAWLSNLTANLKYSLPLDVLGRLVSRYGIDAPKGPGGSVLYFDANLVHGSSPNMSPFGRALAIITFNSVANALPHSQTPRPEFLAARDFTPLSPVADDALLAYAGSMASR